jgi:nucleoside-diphosphate-sugar epimerase
LQQKSKVICLGRTPLEIENDYACSPLHIPCDLRTGDGLDKVRWAEIETVIHLASAGVKADHRSWTECFAVNVLGTQRLLASIDGAVALKHFILTPTYYERALPQKLSLLENPYVSTKFAASEVARQWARTFPGAVSLASIYQAFGSGDNPANVLNYILSQIRQGKIARISSGRNQRDWIPVDYVVSGLCALVQQSPGYGLHEFDLGSGMLYSIREMAERLAVLSEGGSALLEFDPKLDRGDEDLNFKAYRFLPGWDLSSARLFSALEEFSHL